MAMLFVLQACRQNSKLSDKFKFLLEGDTTEKVKGA